MYLWAWPLSVHARGSGDGTCLTVGSGPLVPLPAVHLYFLPSVSRSHGGVKSFLHNSRDSQRKGTVFAFPSPAVVPGRGLGDFLGTCRKKTCESAVLGDLGLRSNPRLIEMVKGKEVTALAWHFPGSEPSLGR